MCKICKYLGLHEINFFKKNLGQKIIFAILDSTMFELLKPARSMVPSSLGAKLERLDGWTDGKIHRYTYIMKSKKFKNKRKENLFFRSIASCLIVLFYFF